MDKYSYEFLGKTVLLWQPFSSSVPLDEGARGITDNIIGLSSLLSECQKSDGEEREIKRKKNEGNRLLQTHE